MEPKLAAENLQVIRTLMERSAVYRRALAPILLFMGVLGVIAAVTGILLHFDSTAAFDRLWLSTAVVAVIGAFLTARRQALKDQEAFWSPPTRRVAQALLPALTAGTMLGARFLFSDSLSNFTLPLALIWMLFYGCALHSAGFFMPRGVKLFGWIQIASAFSLMTVAAVRPEFIPKTNYVMGFFFGALHLAYCAYLYLTEKKNPVV